MSLSHGERSLSWERHRSIGQVTGEEKDNGCLWKGCMETYWHIYIWVLLELLYTGNNAPPRSHSCQIESPVSSMRLYCLNCSLVSWRPTKLYKGLLVILSAHYKLTVNPCYWRHSTLDLNNAGCHWPGRLFLAGFHSTRRHYLVAKGKKSSIILSC